MKNTKKDMVTRENLIKIYNDFNKLCKTLPFKKKTRSKYSQGLPTIYIAVGCDVKIGETAERYTIYTNINHDDGYIVVLGYSEYIKGEIWGVNSNNNKIKKYKTLAGVSKYIDKISKNTFNYTGLYIQLNQYVEYKEHFETLLKTHLPNLCNQLNTKRRSDYISVGRSQYVTALSQLTPSEYNDLINSEELNKYRVYAPAILEEFCKIKKIPCHAVMTMWLNEKDCESSRKKGKFQFRTIYGDSFIDIKKFEKLFTQETHKNLDTISKYYGVTYDNERTSTIIAKPDVQCVVKNLIVCCSCNGSAQDRDICMQYFYKTSMYFINDYIQYIKSDRPVKMVSNTLRLIKELSNNGYTHFTRVLDLLNAIDNDDVILCDNCHKFTDKEKMDYEPNNTIQITDIGNHHEVVEKDYKQCITCSQNNNVIIEQTINFK